MIEVLENKLKCKKLELEIIEMDIAIKKKKEELREIELKEELTNKVNALGYYPIDSIIVSYRDRIYISLKNNVIDAQRVNNRMCCFNKKLSNQSKLIEIENDTEENIIILKIENKEDVNINQLYEGNLKITGGNILNSEIKASKTAKKIYDNNGLRMAVQRLLSKTTDTLRLNKRKAKLIIFLEKDKELVSKYINIKFQDIVI